MPFGALAGMESSLNAMDSGVTETEAAGVASGAASVVPGAGFFLKNENMETFYNQAIV